VVFLKKMSLILLILLTVLLSSCSPKVEDVPINDSVATSEASSSPSTNTDSTGAPEQKIQVDKGLLNVKVTLPASLFKDSQSTNEEIEINAKAQGIKNVIFNEDGSVTYEMSKDTHKKLLDEFKKSIDDSIKEMLSDSEGTSSFVSIEYNNNCSEFNVMVDSSKYNEWENLIALGFYYQGLFYQCLQGTDPDNAKVIVNFIDKDTGEVLNIADSSKLAEVQ